MAERDLRRKLFWLIAIRVGISTLLLGSAVFVQLTAPGTFPGEPLFLLIGATYALNILWSLTLKWAERYRWIVDIQLACDALIVSGFIAVTGGITSYFAALYVLPIAAASSVQFRRGGMMIATLSALLYVGIVVTQYFGLADLVGVPFLEHQGTLPPVRIVAYMTGLNVFLFFSIAFLSGSLADRLQRAGVRLERASNEIADLQAFNQHVIDSLASGLATTDRQGRILTFNRAAETITGHTSLSVVGRQIEEVLDLPPSVASELTSNAGPGRGRRVESPYHTGDGRQIELGFTATQPAARRETTRACCSRSRMSPTSRGSSATRGCGSGSRPSARWRRASRTRSAIRSRRCRDPFRFSARNCRSPTSRRN